MSSSRAPRSYRRYAIPVLAVAVVAAAAAVFGGALVSRLFPAGYDADGLPVGSVSRDFVLSRPESHLAYPGARLYQAVSAGELRQRGAENPAFAGGVYTTPDSPQQVFAWFARMLAASRWSGPVQQGPLAGQASAEAYLRGRREHLTVGIDGPALARAVLGPAVTPGMTVFEYRYVIDPYGAAASPTPRR